MDFFLCHFSLSSFPKCVCCVFFFFSNSCWNVMQSSTASYFKYSTALSFFFFWEREEETEIQSSKKKKRERSYLRERLNKLLRKKDMPLFLLSLSLHSVFSLRKTRERELSHLSLFFCFYPIRLFFFFSFYGLPLPFLTIYELDEPAFFLCGNEAVVLWYRYKQK